MRIRYRASPNFRTSFRGNRLPARSTFVEKPWNELSWLGVRVFRRSISEPFSHSCLPLSSTTVIPFAPQSQTSICCIYRRSRNEDEKRGSEFIWSLFYLSLLWSLLLLLSFTIASCSQRQQNSKNYSKNSCSFWIVRIFQNQIILTFELKAYFKYLNKSSMQY